MLKSREVFFRAIVCLHFFHATYGSIIIDFRIPLSLSLSLMKVIDINSLAYYIKTEFFKENKRTITLNMIPKLNGKNKIKAINS